MPETMTISSRSMFSSGSLMSSSSATATSRMMTPLPQPGHQMWGRWSMRI